ncbi:MAG: class I tRNA ligase family protein [Thermoplasmatota archaeon]
MIKPGVERYDAPKLEKKIRDQWDSIDLSDTLSEEREGARTMYAVHLPQLLTKDMTIKDMYVSVIYDILTRYNFMKNYDMKGDYGFDPFTLSVEDDVIISEGFGKIENVSDEDMRSFIEECFDHSSDLKEEKIEKFKELALLFHEDNIYDTSKESYIDSLWSRLKKLSDDGILYKKKSMLPWCPTCGSSLSQLEIEKRDVSAYTNILKIPSGKGSNRYYLVEIDDPWKLLGMAGLSVDGDKEYCVLSYQFDGKEEKSIVSKESLSDIKDKLDIEGYKIQNTVKGEKLDGLNFENPIADKVPFLGDSEKDFKVVVTDENLGSVTGISPIYPSIDKESYKVGKRFDLDMNCPIDGKGYVKSEDHYGKFAGYHINKSNVKIIEQLKSEGLLISQYEKMKESDFCINSNSEIIYRFDEEWFFKISDIELEIKEMIDDIDWAPKKYSVDELKERMVTEDLHITRRKGWGIPFPMWNCECGNTLMPESVEDLFEKIGSEVDVNKLLDLESIEMACPECGKQMGWEERVLNPVFISSASPFSQLGHIKHGEEFEDIWPGDLVILNKGKDDSVLMGLLAFSAVFFDKPSVKKVIETGEIKLSGIGDLDLDQNIDSLRLGLLRDQSIYEDHELKEIDEENVDRLIRVLWNIYNSFSEIMKDERFDPEEIDIEDIQEELEIEERWLLSRTETMVGKVEDSYDAYNYDEVVEYIQKFVLDDIAQWYFTLFGSKMEEADEKDRRSILKILHKALVDVSILLSPICPYISEEIYQELEGKFDSVFLCERPVVNKMLIDEEIENEMNSVMDIVDKITRRKTDGGLPEKWPLKRIVVKSEEIKLQSLVGRFGDIIKQKAKVKDILSIGVGEEWDEMDLKVHPNRNAIGKSYRQWSSKIELMLKKRPAKKIKEGIEKGEYSLGIDGRILEIQPNMVEFEKEVPEGFIEVETEGGFIYLDLEIDTDLWDDEIANEIRLRLKSMMKEFDLKKGDETEVYIHAPQDFIEAYKVHVDDISEELNIRENHYGREWLEEAEYVLEWEINGEPVDIGVTPLYKGKVMDMYRSIPGMSEEKGKILYNEGYTRLEKLMDASIDDLSSIDGIKKSLATRIIQVVKERGRDIERSMEEKEEEEAGVEEIEEPVEEAVVSEETAEQVKEEPEPEPEKEEEPEEQEEPEESTEEEIEEETEDEGVEEGSVEVQEEEEISGEREEVEAEEIDEAKEEGDIEGSGEEEKPEEQVEEEKEEEEGVGGGYEISESKGEEVCKVCNGDIQEGSNMVTCDCGKDYHIQCGIKEGKCPECGNIFNDDLLNYIKHDLPEGFFKSTTYLITEESEDDSMQFFKDILESGMNGMLVTRQYPKKVKKIHGLEDVSVIWLSSVDRENAVSPKNLEKFSLSTEDFLKNKEGVILLYGLQYLIDNNDFDTVLHIIQSLKDQIAVSESILMISINPKMMEEEDLEVLETEVDQVLS